MTVLSIADNSLQSWAAYGRTFGFVPDPMILRAGEIFLNGAKGAAALQRDDREVWQALEQNIGGIVDFFDMVVTRDAIPLINYGDTFDRATTHLPLDTLLGNRVQAVEIGYEAYIEVKRGALANLRRMNLGGLSGAAAALAELDAFRYDWQPALWVPGDGDGGPPQQAHRDPATTLAQFLLGGFIFSGFAQASATTHYIQPKRARFFLGLTTAPDRIGQLSRADEKQIFETAEARLRGVAATVTHPPPLPPVLPYLLGTGMPPTTPRALLDRALAFRESQDGRAYRALVDDIRADGVAARRTEALAKQEWREAVALLAPYSNLEPAQSTTLDVKLKGELFGIGAEAAKKIPLAPPPWLRLWWNDRVPFGGVRKTLRRLWMHAAAYQSMSTKLRDIWIGA